MGKQVNLSVIILESDWVKESVYKKCLESVSWADEVVKIKTKDIKGSFSEWRGEGIKKAKGKWIFYVDMDEEVTTPLKDEILELINSGNESFSCYAVPRRNNIFGKEFKHSGQYPDYQKRLFLKTQIFGWKGDLHEEPVYHGNMGYLKNPLLHHKDITLSQMVEKTNEWSEIEAKLMFAAHHPKMNFFRFFTAGFREFWRRMLIQLAFLDGAEGVIYALYQVYSRLISYSKLWELQLRSDKGNTSVTGVI